MMEMTQTSHPLSTSLRILDLEIMLYLATIFIRACLGKGSTAKTFVVRKESAHQNRTDGVA